MLSAPNLGQDAILLHPPVEPPEQALKALIIGNHDITQIASPPSYHLTNNNEVIAACQPRAPRLYPPRVGQLALICPANTGAWSGFYRGKVDTQETSHNLTLKNHWSLLGLRPEEHCLSRRVLGNWFSSVSREPPRHQKLMPGLSHD